MDRIKTVLDTNVLVSALRSNKGAGFQILRHLGSRGFDLCISVALVLEYEEILKKTRNENQLSESDIDDLVDYLCSVGMKFPIHYLWRPTLRDPDDEMILELAVAAQVDFIVTYNVKDFIKSNIFGVKVITPVQFLKKLGGK